MTRAASSRATSGRAPAVRAVSLKQQLESLVAEMTRRGIRLDEALAQLEREYLRRTLKERGGNQTQAAADLQLHRNTLRRKLTEHGLDPERL